MLITSIPNFVSNFVDSIDSLSYHQKKSAKRYVTGLIASGKKTANAISKLFAEKFSQRSIGRFLSEYDWSHDKTNWKRITELQKHNETRWSKYGVGILDDTLLEKAGDKIPFVGKFFDHTKNSYIHGQNLVTLHYADRKIHYPVSYMFYQKKGNDEFKTKIEIAIKLIKEAVDNGMQCSIFSGDSWFFCREIIDFLESMDRDWIFACKSGLLVRVELNKFISLGEYVKRIPKERFFECEIEGKKYKLYTKTLYFHSLERYARLVVSIDGKNEMLLIVTNRRDMHRKIVARYMLRGSIDVFYRDGKQYLGLGECRARNAKAANRHIESVFLAYSSLRLVVTEHKIAKRSIRSSISHELKSALFFLLEKMVLWIYSIRSMEGLIKVIEEFKYRLM